MLTTPTASDPVNLNFMNTSVLYCQRRLLYRQLSNSKGSLHSKSVVTDSAEQSSETIMFGNVQLLTPRLIIVFTLQCCLQLNTYGYNVQRPVLAIRFHSSARFQLLSVTSDVSNPPDPPARLITGMTGKVIDGEAARLTPAESAAMDAINTPNKRPPVVKSKDIYANIYSGIYNQPFELEEEDISDEIENTSFYSNIYYSYDDETDGDDFMDIKSTMTSQITDNDDVVGSDASMIGRINARPPLVSSLTTPINQSEDMASLDAASVSGSDITESGTDVIIESVNKRPPLKRTSVLTVDGFSVRPMSKEVESLEKNMEMNAIYSNIYSGLYNQPVEDVEEDGVGYDEIENTSFYSNIYYSYDDDEDNDDTSIRSGKNSSNITSNIPENDDKIGREHV